ncbi:hypothetical protein CCB80_02750 [Armatimonadetes bacterium Uphvl-Ar1]|nr:hypothetical protein CCB80_02750 [Armatimonadetes bacterium Uphvl-Ar1]
MLATLAFSLLTLQERPRLGDLETRSLLESRALTWLTQNATPLQADIPTPEELKPIVNALDTARVIGLGEPTHGDHQSQLFKTHAIRELVRQNKINALMLEINREPAAQFDAYVNEGKGDLTDLMVNSGLFSIWRTDDFANLIIWLRAYVVRTGNPIRIYGVDCQDAQVDIIHAINFLKLHDPERAKQAEKDFANLIAHNEDEKTIYVFIQSQPTEEFARLTKVCDELTAYLDSKKENLSSKPGFDEALYSIRVAKQMFLAYEFEFGGQEPDFSKMPPDYFARRDVFMAQNLVERLGDQRAALWAHDGHTLSNLPDYIAASGYKTIGSQLKSQLGKDYVSLGFAWTRGSFRARLVKAGTPLVEAQRIDFTPHNLSSDKPDDLGELLARLPHQRFIADLRSADEKTKEWANLPYFRGWCGWAVDPENWMKDPSQFAAPTFVHDVLVYYREISPSTVWELPPKK